MYHATLYIRPNDCEIITMFQLYCYHSCLSLFVIDKYNVINLGLLTICAELLFSRYVAYCMYCISVSE